MCSYYVVVPLTLLDSRLLRHVVNMMPEFPAMLQNISNLRLEDFDLVALLRELGAIQILVREYYILNTQVNLAFF